MNCRQGREGRGREGKDMRTLAKGDFARDRFDEHGRITYMCHTRGWVMVRRPGSIPFTMMEKEWLVMPFFEADKAAS
jgi:hypothetical protein